MKITKLRLKNLNSLYGEWIIDFSLPEFNSNGIFAITGPMGSGKTTILDAICLALYGRTPRIASIATVNEIISKNTADCLSEVTFQTHEGTFLAVWSQRRANLKVDGKLQAPLRVFSNLSTGKSLSNKSKVVESLVIEKTGMDFQRFSRSMMLAQGAFAAFLQASSNDRAELLEQITDTSIYSEISSYIYKFTSSLKNSLEFDQHALQSIQILSQDQEQEKVAALQSIEGDLKEQHSRLTNLDETISVYNSRQALQNNLQEISIENSKLLNEEKEFQSSIEVLKTARSALNVLPLFNQFNALRQEQIKANNQLISQKEKLPHLHVHFENAKKENSECLTVLDVAINLLQKERIIAENVNALDQKIDLQSKQNSTLLEQYNAIKKTFLDNEKHLACFNKENHDNKKLLESVEEFLITHQNHADLIHNSDMIFNQMKNFSDLQKTLHDDALEIANKKTQLEKIENELSFLHKKFESEKIEYQTKSANISLLQKEKVQLLQNRIINEWINDLTHLQDKKNLQLRIISLEEQRKLLEDGNPCPLCGSLEHPYTHGNVPTIDEITQQIMEVQKIISAADAQERKIVSEDKILQNSQLDLIKMETEIGYKKKNILDIKSIIENMIQKQSEKIDQEKMQGEQIKELLAKYSIFFDLNKVDEIKQSINSACQLYQSKVFEAEKFKKNESLLNEKIVTLIAQQKSHEENIKSLNAKITNLESDIKISKKERFAIYSDKVVRAELEKLEKNHAVAQKNVQTCVLNCQQFQTKIKEIEASITIVSEQILSREGDLESSNKLFIAACEDNNFATEEDFSKSLLGSSYYEKLQQDESFLQKRRTEIDARYKSCHLELSNEKYKNINLENLPNVIEEKNVTQSSYNLLLERLGQIRAEIDINSKNKINFESKLKTINDANNNYQRWEKLNKLIGSANGDKFRKYVQGLTFEIVVSHANDQLVKMSDRYILERDLLDPLALNVVDNYQGCEKRSTKNLSGGESFIISLALALGLANISSRNVSVDSLFLDEGFGTLDEDALDVALNTLSTLQSSGKIIGVISHINVLKERIPTKIEVSYQTGGRSILSGPGISRIN